MRIAIQADDGDEVSIYADLLALEHGLITLEIENQLYSEISEFDSVTLTIGKARELAAALLTVAQDLEFVRGTTASKLAALVLPMRSATGAARKN